MLLITLLIPIYEPNLFTQYSITVYLYSFLNILLCCYFLMRNIFFDGISRVAFFWIVYRVYMLLMMIINLNLDGLLQWGIQSLMVFNLINVFEYARKKNCMKDLLLLMSILGITLLFANYISLITLDRGFIRSSYWNNTDSDFYLLGIKTMFTTMMVPTIATSFVYCKLERTKSSKFPMILSIIVSVLNISVKGISTAIVGGVICVILYLLERRTKYIIPHFALVIIAVAVNIAVVFFNFQNVFSFFIQAILHKDVTLTARVSIWNSAKDLFANQEILKTIFGNGYRREFVPFQNSLWQPHNQVLSTVYAVGIMGTVVFLIFLIWLAKDNQKNNSVYGMISIICFSVLIMCITEVLLDVAVSYIPFLLLYYVTPTMNTFDKNFEKAGR